MISHIYQFSYNLIILLMQASPIFPTHVSTFHRIFKPNLSFSNFACEESGCTTAFSFIHLIDKGRPIFSPSPSCRRRRRTDASHPGDLSRNRPRRFPNLVGETILFFFGKRFFKLRKFPLLLVQIACRYQSPSGIGFSWSAVLAVASLFSLPPSALLM